MDYGYRCRKCGATYTYSSNSISLYCCGQKTPRDFSFNIGTSFREHYNKSLGMYVPNRSTMNDAFKVSSDAASSYTGIEHNFVPKDPYDHEAFGISSDDIAESKEHYAKAIESGTITPEDIQ